MSELLKDSESIWCSKQSLEAAVALAVAVACLSAFRIESIECNRFIRHVFQLEVT